MKIIQYKGKKYPDMYAAAKAANMSATTFYNTAKWKYYEPKIKDEKESTEKK